MYPDAKSESRAGGPLAELDLVPHSPDVGRALEELGVALRQETALTARVREIAILLVALATGDHRRWRVHEPIALSAGLTAEDIMRLSLGCFTSDDPAELAASSFCRHLLTSSAFSHEEYVDLGSDLPMSSMVELAVLMGHYRTLAQISSVLDAAVLPVGDQPRQGLVGHGCPAH